MKWKQDRKSRKQNKEFILGKNPTECLSALSTRGFWSVNCVSKVSLHEVGCLGLVHWMTLRDRMGREVGERVQMGNICTPMADSCECMAKTTTIL